MLDTGFPSKAFEDKLRRHDKDAGLIGLCKARDFYGISFAGVQKIRFSIRSRTVQI
jgi:hypothetical protein